MAGFVFRPYDITRLDVQSHPDWLFAFGDNLARTGRGGQAREMRGEPNAVGIPTKHQPTRYERDYFTDDDFPEARLAIDEAFARLRKHLLGGGVVVVPADGIGTGLAELPRRAPRIAKYIERHIAALEGLP